MASSSVNSSPFYSLTGPFQGYCIILDEIDAFDAQMPCRYYSFCGKLSEFNASHFKFEGNFPSLICSTCLWRFERDIEISLWNIAMYELIQQNPPVNHPMPSSDEDPWGTYDSEVLLPPLPSSDDDLWRAADIGEEVNEIAYVSEEY